MRIYRHLDWLSVTIPDNQNWRQFLPGLDWLLGEQGRHGYQRKYTDKKTGAVIETDSTRADMGAHLTLSGEPLAELRALGIAETDDWLAERIQEYDAKCSRIDMAIDCYGATFTPAMLARAIEDGSAKLRARTWRFIDGHKNGILGSTVDTGSTLSDKRFRFYDKRAEMRIKDGDAWVRLELQLRRVYAKNAIASCTLNGTEATITGHIADYLHWQNPDYTQVLIAPSAVPPHVPRKDAKRRTWLKGQVARALASEVVKDAAFRAEFDQMVNYWIDELRKRLTKGL